MIDILLALALLLGTGLVASIVLILASHYMGVPVNNTVKDLRERLPGANCGACGYNGCDGYAEALANGECACNLCVPGGSGVSKELSDILGTESSECISLVAYIHCGGTCEVTEKAAEYEGLRTCAAMCLAGGGPNSCKFGCLGCLDCASVCPVDAIYEKEGIAKVNPNICIGCGKCTKTCPKNIISLIPKDADVAVKCSSHDSGAVTRTKCKAGCIGCKKCEKACSNGSVTVKDNLSYIDYEKCVKCGECAAVCPTNCIVILK